MAAAPQAPPGASIHRGIHRRRAHALAARTGPDSPCSDRDPTRPWPFRGTRRASTGRRARGQDRQQHAHNAHGLPQQRRQGRTDRDEPSNRSTTIPKDAHRARLPTPARDTRLSRLLQHRVRATRRAIDRNRRPNQRGARHPPERPRARYHRRMGHHRPRPQTGRHNRLHQVQTPQNNRDRPQTRTPPGEPSHRAPARIPGRERCWLLVHRATPRPPKTGRALDEQPRVPPTRPPDRRTVGGWHAQTLQSAALRHMPLHSLRHTAAAAWLAADNSLLYVQQQLGHRDLSTTSHYYGHLERHHNPTRGAHATEQAITRANPN